jgi:hypothetical protein
MCDRRVSPVVATIYSEGYAALSPNGRWLAYQSDDSGRNEVYIERWVPSAPGSGRRWKISDGGGLPRWRGDGAELFYMTSSGRLMAAAVHPAESEFRFDTPRILFDTHPVPKTWNLFDTAPDGLRFLLNLPFEWPQNARTTVLTNWAEKLTH